MKGPLTPPGGRVAGAAGAKGKGAGKRAAAGRAGGPPPTDLLSQEARARSPSPMAQEGQHEFDNSFMPFFGSAAADVALVGAAYLVGGRP